MTKLEKALAMVCFGRLAGYLAIDTAPETKDKLEEAYNCKNCDSFKYCCELADTLKE